MKKNNLIKNLIKGFEYVVENADAFDKIIEIGKEITDWFKNIFNIGDTPSYDKDNATIDDTKKINKLILKTLLRFRKNMIKFQKSK